MRARPEVYMPRIEPDKKPSGGIGDRGTKINLGYQPIREVPRLDTGLLTYR